MKKIFLIIVIFFCFCSMSIVSNADTSEHHLYPTPYDRIPVDEVKTKMSVSQFFKGKTFLDGAIGYYYRINVNNVGKEIPYHKCLYGVEICFASHQAMIDGRDKIDFKMIRRPTVAAFVAFNNGGVKRGYEYTLLSCLGYTTDEYSGSREASFGFDSLFGYKSLYSSEMKEDTSITTEHVDSTKQRAHLVWVGDVYVSQVDVALMQKLWLGDNKVWNVDGALCFVISNLSLKVVCFD